MPAECFLGIERSATGRRWEARPLDARLAQALAQRLSLPELVCRVLASRGIALEQAEGWLEPRLRDHLPDPSGLVDMDAAVARIAAAVEAGEGIAVFGDYDVDGATATALLLRYFAALGVPARFYIPDRLAEGYGPNAAALQRLAAEGWRLVVTVDCGSTAHDAMAAAAAAGADVVVIDHHKCAAPLPRVAALVNPNRQDGASPAVLRDLAAVGVAFMLTVALNRALRRAGWFRRSRRPEPDLLEWLDLVALGTVCDSVPLTALNRALVGQGLKVVARRGNTGLAALTDIAGLKERATPYHLGFVLGPRVNAGGRVGEASLGARLLSIGDPGEALEIAGRLEAFNRERQRIEGEVLAAALAAVESGPDAPVLVAAGAGWHPGVIGIVASRLVDRLGRPACVVALGDNGIGKGSGRSVPGFDLGQAVIAAHREGLLVKGGGHAMAAGFEIALDRMAAFCDFLRQAVPAALAGERPRPRLQLDGALRPAAVTGDLARLIERAGPYGMGNPEPCFALAAARIVRADIVGKGHVRCILTDPGGGRLKGIAFRAADTGLGAALLSPGGRALHVAGRLRADSWEGRDGAQLIVEDAAVPVSGA